MNVVDSSGWIEYFYSRPNSGFFRPPIQDTASLIVPAIVLYEVFRYITRSAGRDSALAAAAQMQKARVADLDAGLATIAAQLGLRHNLPLADSIVYATAQAHAARLYTQDQDFEKLSGVKYIAKK